MQLTFKRTKNYGETCYTAQTATHRYVALRDPSRRKRDGEWIVNVWTLKTVGAIDPLAIADEKVTVLDYHYTRASAYTDAQTHADRTA